MILGAGTTLFLLEFSGAFLIDIETGSFNPAISALDVVFILFFLFFLLRGIAFLRVGRRFSREIPPEYQDWTETRQWRWVVILALPIGGLLLGVSVLLWEWWSVVYLYEADLLMLSMILVGFFLHLYTFYRTGVKII